MASLRRDIDFQIYETERGHGRLYESITGCMSLGEAELRGAFQLRVRLSLYIAIALLYLTYIVPK